jgi:prophage regulatory protein
MNIWRIETCKAVTGYRSTASIYNNIRDGLWPKAVNIGRRSVGWPSDEIIAINAARIAGQTDAQIRELVKRLEAKRSELTSTINDVQNVYLIPSSREVK